MVITMFHDGIMEGIENNGLSFRLLIFFQSNVKGIFCIAGGL